MSGNVLVYGKAFTTSYIFIHVLRRILGWAGAHLRGHHFHLVLDDRQDAAYARSLLPGDRVTVHAQYATLDPFREDLRWPPETVERWERFYGSPHFRIYMDNERILEGRREEEKWRYLLSHLEYFERFCLETRPVLYVSGAASSIHPWIGMEVFRRNGVPCLSFYPARFGACSFLLDGPYETLNVRTLYKDLAARGLSPAEEAEASAVIEDYRLRGFKPIDDLYVKAKRLRALPQPWRALRALWEARFTDQRFYDEPFRVLAARSLRARLTRFYDWYLRGRTWREVDRSRPFFFFPLQFEPEMSLITQGRGWTDQLELIRLISQSLPIDCWLYVKEHPNMPVGVRPLAFYRELTRLPRVRLLDRRLNSYAIVPHAEAVLTITSTAGWEALMFNRPVALFGHAFYEEFEEGVVSVTRPEELPAILRDLRNRKFSDEALLAYVAAVRRRMEKGILVEPRYFPTAAPLVMSDENLDSIGRVILARLGVG